CLPARPILWRRCLKSASTGTRVSPCGKWAVSRNLAFRKTRCPSSHPETTMANLGNKNGVFLARFRFQGKEFKKSLKTTDRKAAEAAMHRVEDALPRLAIGLIRVPEGVDPGDFVVSGGTLTAPTDHPGPRSVPTLTAAIKEYLSNLGHVAATNR